jgi:hypothetical protein
MQDVEDPAAWGAVAAISTRLKSESAIPAAIEVVQDSTRGLEAGPCLSMFKLNSIALFPRKHSLTESSHLTLQVSFGQAGKCTYSTLPSHSFSATLSFRQLSSKLPTLRPVSDPASYFECF